MLLVYAIKVWGSPDLQTAIYCDITEELLEFVNINRLTGEITSTYTFQNKRVASM